jgi:hypothetical protein
MYSFIALSAETQNKFVSIMEENLKTLNQSIIPSSFFQKQLMNFLIIFKIILIRKKES